MRSSVPSDLGNRFHPDVTGHGVWLWHGAVYDGRRPMELADTLGRQ